MFRKDDIDRLIAHDAFPAITFSLPTHIGSREVRQDRIRLRNLSATALDRLTAAGVDRGKADELMRPVRNLADDESFWLEQSPGLVVFAAQGVFELLRLPFSPVEELIVGRRFHLRHLLPALDGDYPFVILTISARHARLFHAGRYDIREQHDADFPMQYREWPKEMSDLARLGNGGERRMMAADERKSAIVDFLSRVAEAAGRQTNARDLPVVLVALPEFAGHFRNVAKLRNLCDRELSENPESLDERTLHRMAYDTIRPHFQARDDQALEKFNVVFGQSHPRASVDIAEVVEAARSGRVDTLFVADDTHLWGKLDGAEGLVQHAEQRPEDEDILDYAAALTWRNGGAVRVLPRSIAPFGKPVSAIFRY